MVIITEFNFGDLVKDSITGYEGVIVGVRRLIGENVLYGLQPQYFDGDGIPEWEWIVGERLKLIMPQKVELVNLGKEKETNENRDR